MSCFLDRALVKVVVIDYVQWSMLILIQRCDFTKWRKVISMPLQSLAVLQITVFYIWVPKIMRV